MWRKIKVINTPRWIRQWLATKKSLAYLCKKLVQIWMRLWVDCDFKQRNENILQHLLEILHKILGSVDITATNGKQKNENSDVKDCMGSEKVIIINFAVGKKRMIMEYPINRWQWKWWQHWWIIQSRQHITSFAKSLIIEIQWQFLPHWPWWTTTVLIYDEDTKTHPNFCTVCDCLKLTSNNIVHQKWLHV